MLRAEYYDPGNILQTQPDMAIVDEADFIMIDESRIPLVIAAESEERRIDPVHIDGAVRRLTEGVDFAEDRAGRLHRGP